MLRAIRARISRWPRAIVECHERTGAARLDEAVATARTAARLWRDAPDASLWEGIVSRPQNVHAILMAKARDLAHIDEQAR